MLQLVTFLLFLTHLVVSRSIQEVFATPVARPRARKRGQAVINVSVVQPKICTTSALAFSTQTAIPSGYFQIVDNINTGWGPTGSIWNISTEGIPIKSLKAPCQGSTCLGWNGAGNAETSGKIVKLTDYLWQLNVTADMQPSVMLFGELGDASNASSSINPTSSRVSTLRPASASLVNTAASGLSRTTVSGLSLNVVASGSSINVGASRSSSSIGASGSSTNTLLSASPSQSANVTFVPRLLRRQNGGTFKLVITSTPPCALPVAQNCTARDFLPSATQWEAYSVDKWLADYIPKKGIRDFSELYNNLAGDYFSATEAALMNCGPDSRTYYCVPPAGAELVYDCPSQDATPGIIALWGVIRVSNVLRFIYATYDAVEADVTNWVEQLVDTFVKPTVEQKWTAIVSAVSSIIGIIVAFAIIIDVLTEGAATGWLVAAVVGISNTLGAATNFFNGFTTQLPDDTYLKYTGQYKQGVTEWALAMRNATAGVWSQASPLPNGGEGVMKLLAGGNWLTVPNPLNETGIGTALNNWFDVTLLASLINQSWKNNKFYVQFIPYDNIIDIGWNGRTAPNITFTHDICAQHWANDPHRSNYISCDLNYGGQAGMTVLAMPSSEKGTVIDLVKNAKFQEAQINYKFDPEDLLQSSLTGNALYGYNYNITLSQMQNVLQAGAANLANSFGPLALDAPGLYNLDVCVLEDLGQVSGSLQWISSDGNTYHKNNMRWKVGCPDPCACKNFGVHGQLFTNYTNPELVALINATAKPAIPDPCSFACVMASRKL